MRSPGPDRDQSAERLDKKGKSTGKSKNKKKSSIVSPAAGKPSDLPSNMPSTGYSLPISTDVPVVPASQPVFTGPTSQPTSISSVPASSAISALAAGCGLTGSQQFVSPDQASVASDYEHLQATSDKESEEGEISDTEGQEKKQRNKL